MDCIIEAANGQIGFGATRSEALRDLHINLCKQNLSYDKGEFLELRKKLHPWFPKQNMLHISGVGCLVYERGYVINTANDKKVYIEYSGPSIYSVLAEVVGDALTYESIAIAIREELDLFFKRISLSFTPISEMPFIKMVQMKNGFEPDVIYQSSYGHLIGISDREVGMKRSGDIAFNVVDLDNNKNYYSDILAYIGYKMGIVVIKGVPQNG